MEKFIINIKVFIIYFCFGFTIPVEGAFNNLTDLSSTNSNCTSLENITIHEYKTNINSESSKKNVNFLTSKNRLNLPLASIKSALQDVGAKVYMKKEYISTIDVRKKFLNNVMQINIKKRSAIPTNVSNRSKINSVFERARNLNFTRDNRKGVVSILGLFDLTNRSGIRPEGRSELVAAQMAVKHINKLGLLPGYVLELITNDTECDPGVGVDRFFHGLYKRRTTFLMLLGSACSDVTEQLAKIVPYWNIVQLSFGSTSPALSDRNEFPLFYRTVSPDSIHNNARIAFIKRFFWRSVTTFSQNEEIHSLAVNELVTELESANISCTATLTFAETDLKEQLKFLKELDTRIIIGSFSHHVAPKVFCEAFNLGMYGAEYVWILQETHGEPWWLNPTLECSRKDLEKAAESLIIVGSHNSIVGSEISYSGLTNKMFTDEMLLLNVSIPFSKFARQTYDAVFCIVLALTKAEQKWKNESMNIKLNNFDYTRDDMSMEFLSQLSKIEFLGVSGPVSFSGSDRIAISAFYQVQSGVLKPIALYYPSSGDLNFNCPDCVSIKWQSEQIPIAKRIFKLRIATIQRQAFYTITSIASVCICITFLFLGLNLHFRKLKTIKLSSPKLSNITAIGCIFVYAAVILLGFDYSTLKSIGTPFPAICTARVYLLSTGFSLAFGSMFAKTYRVHRIFTHSAGSVCKNKMLRDTQLIILVFALILLDVIVVTLWVINDPMERHLNNLSLEINPKDRSVVYQPQVEVCRSQHTQSWLGVLYVYKGLLLIVGVYMAWETRHVKVPALNDSQYIGISVYSVVITSAIVVALANLITERVTLAYLTVTTLIIISTTSCVCLLFLPKMNDIWTKSGKTDHVISMGLKMEYNTRRFLMDDRRELQYRVEVQNRVYKKEVAALDAQILKLERILSNSSSSSASSISLPHQIKTEINIIEPYEESPTFTRPNRLSISDGLPLLLLSVLPPVIPRASWPTTDRTNTMRRSVTFSSQPYLDEGPSTSRLPAIDLFNLRLTHQQATQNRKGFLDKIRDIFVPSRKSSTEGIAAAIKKVHMGGLFTSLIPSSGTLSCNALNTIASKRRNLRKNSSMEILEPINIINHSQPKVNFQLPDRKSSFCHQSSEQSLREKIRCSPRYPHKIVPTCSLNALEDSENMIEEDPLDNYRTEPKSKWKSMEETKFSLSST